MRCLTTTFFSITMLLKSCCFNSYCSIKKQARALRLSQQLVTVTVRVNNNIYQLFTKAEVNTGREFIYPLSTGLVCNNTSSLIQAADRHKSQGKEKLVPVYTLHSSLSCELKLSSLYPHSSQHRFV